jgi:hypothetical protein
MCDLHLALYMFLYVYVVVCVISNLTMRLPNPAYLQDAADNQDAHGRGGGGGIK